MIDGSAHPRDRPPRNRGPSAKKIQTICVPDARRDALPVNPPPPYLEDLELASRALGGDLDAIDDLTVRMRTIQKILESLPMTRRDRGMVEGLEDLAQDCALLVWKKLATYAGLSTFESWMYGICKFEYRNWLRRRCRDSSRMDDVGQDFDDEIIFFNSHDDLLLAQMLERIDSLKPPVPDIFRLKYGKALTYREIAGLVGRPESSVKSLHRRALRKLRRLFNKDRDEKPK